MSHPLAYLHDQLAEWKRDGVYQRLRILESASAAESRFDGKEVINLASNNYLGLTTHPKLCEAAIDAVKRFGAGSGPEDHIISDELNPASIIDGCRLSRAKIRVFPHRDAAAAEKILAELDGVSGKKALISDGFFSMDGDIGALPGLVEA